MKRRYFVETWDSDLQAWTPQKGVRKGPYSLMGLRKAIRALRGMGYSADRGDASVYVYSPEVEPVKIIDLDTIDREIDVQKAFDEGYP